MDHDASDAGSFPGRALLLTLAAVAAGLTMTLASSGEAHASDDEDRGLLSSVVDTVRAVEDPLLGAVSGTFDETVGGVTEIVSSTVATVAPPVAAVTDPVVTGVTRPVTTTVGTVAEGQPLTTVTGTVATTVERVVDRVPVVNDVVDALPPLPAAPEPPVPSVEVPEQNAPSTGAPTVTDPPSAEIFAKAHDVEPPRHRGVPPTLTATELNSAPAGGTPEAAPQHGQEQKHPAAPASSPANGSAGGGSSPTAHHPGELHAALHLHLDTGMTGPSADEHPPTFPTFDSDATPD